MNSPPIAAKSLEFPMELFEIAAVLILCRAAIFSQHFRETNPARRGERRRW